MSGSQFFRITIEILLGEDALEESRVSMAFLTISRVAKIFRFRIVSESKTRQQLSESSRLELSGKNSANRLTDIEDNN